MKNKIISIIGLSLPLLSFAQINFFGSAGRNNYGGGYSGFTGGGAAIQAPVRSVDDVLRIINTLIGWGQAILFVIVAIMVLFAAYKFVLNQDTAGARSILIYAAVGVVVALLAYAIPPVVCGLLGTSC